MNNRDECKEPKAASNIMELLDADGMLPKEMKSELKPDDD